MPEELLVLEPLPEEQKFPDTMADDIILLNYQVDIDRRPQPPVQEQGQPVQQMSQAQRNEAQF